jgi:hypothetical protein
MISLENSGKGKLILQAAKVFLWKRGIYKQLINHKSGIGAKFFP